MAPTGFLDFPSELRLAIYDKIVSSVFVVASPYLRPYNSLILSCRQVYNEFQTEALKDVDGLFKCLEATTIAELKIPIFGKFADTVQPTILLPHGWDKTSTYDGLMSILARRSFV